MTVSIYGKVVLKNTYFEDIISTNGKLVLKNTDFKDIISNYGNIYTYNFLPTSTISGYINLVRGSSGWRVYSVDQDEVNDINVDSIYRIMGIG